MSPWGGRRVVQMRAEWATQLPLPCLRCGELIQPTDEWHIGHRYPRAIYPELAWVSSNQWPEHASCNLAGGTSLPSPPTVDRRPW